MPTDIDAQQPGCARDGKLTKKEQAYGNASFPPYIGGIICYFPRCIRVRVIDCDYDYGSILWFKLSYYAGFTTLPVRQHFFVIFQDQDNHLINMMDMLLQIYLFVKTPRNLYVTRNSFYFRRILIYFAGMDQIVYTKRL